VDENYNLFLEQTMFMKKSPEPTVLLTVKKESSGQAPACRFPD